MLSRSWGGGEGEQVTRQPKLHQPGRQEPESAAGWQQHVPLFWFNIEGRHCVSDGESVSYLKLTAVHPSMDNLSMIVLLK